MLWYKWKTVNSDAKSNHSLTQQVDLYNFTWLAGLDKTIVTFLRTSLNFSILHIFESSFSFDKHDTHEMWYVLIFKYFRCCEMCASLIPTHLSQRKVLLLWFFCGGLDSVNLEEALSLTNRCLYWYHFGWGKLQMITLEATLTQAMEMLNCVNINKLFFAK